VQESMPGGVDAPPTGVAAVGSPRDDDGPLGDPRALQILSTEHWSLLASRSLSYNEAFSRAAMFLTFLSASLIVIGFLVGNQDLTGVGLPAAAILLAADLFIGLATVGRLIDANSEELACVRGMNRIRHAYREMVPGIDGYFITGFHDDVQGVLATYGGGGTAIQNVIHGLTTTVGMIATIDALIFGALVGVISVGLGAGIEVAVAVALVGLLVSFVILVFIGARTVIGSQNAIEPRFPTPTDPGSETRTSGGPSDES
jgi:hypothetical protein